MSRQSLLFLILVSAMLLGGCGGGGGGGGGSTPPAPNLQVSGVAKKGLIRYGLVTANKMLANGSPDSTTIDSTITDGNGNFSLNIPLGSGPVIITVSGRDTASTSYPASYYVDDTDPAGVRTIPFNSSEALESIIVVNNAAIQNLAVTPFTDMVADLTRTFFNATLYPNPPKDLQTAIVAATGIVTAIAKTLGIQDITNPSDSGYDYALKIFTQYMLTRTAAGASPNCELAAEAFIDSAMADVTVLNTALANAAQTLGIAAPATIVQPAKPNFASSTPLPAGAVVTLRTEGVLPSGSLIGAIDITVNLPPGVTLNASPSTINPAVLVPDAGVVTLQGAAANASNQLQATYVSGTSGKVVIRLVAPNGLSTGVFAAINCTVAGGVSPLPTDFSISSNKASTTGVSDLNTTPLSAVEVKFTATGNSLGIVSSQGTPGALTLSTAGTLPTGSLIGAIDVTLNLPAWVTLNATPSTINPAVLVPDTGVVTLLGAAAGAGNQLEATYVRGATGKLIIRLISPNGLAAGDFATVKYYVATGVTAPPLSAFSITPNNASTTGVFDLNTAVLSGININIR